MVGEHWTRIVPNYDHSLGVSQLQLQPRPDFPTKGRFTSGREVTQEGVGWVEGGRARRREEGRKPLGTPCLTPLCEPLCQTAGTELAPAPRGKLTAEHQVTLESGRAGFDQGRELRSGLI